MLHVTSLQIDSIFTNMGKRTISYMLFLNQLMKTILYPIKLEENFVMNSLTNKFGIIPICNLVISVI